MFDTVRTINCVIQERKSLFSNRQAGGGKRKLKCEQFNSCLYSVVCFFIGNNSVTQAQ
jgi:hypothetical protein